MFTNKFLLEIRREALRKRVWFNALDIVERGILDISARVFNVVKSELLNIQLVRIIAKLRYAFKSDFINYLERYGMERVRIIRSQAASFGYQRAESLLGDFEFVRYLIFLDYHQPINWRIYS